MTTLDDNFNISVIALLPLAVVFYLAYKKVPPLPTILFGALLGGILAVFLQPEGVLALADDPALSTGMAMAKGVWLALSSGYVSTTGVAAVDDLLTFLGKYETEDEEKRLANPAWHIHSGKPPREDAHLSFNILLNLAGVANADDKSVLWGFIARYAPNASPATDPILDSLAGYAIRYYQDFVKPSKKYRAPSDMERAALEDLVAELEKLPEGASAEDIQTEVYEVGKRHPFESLRHWFKACYEILLGQDQGPRLGSFIALYGVAETVTLIRRALAGENLAA